MHIFYQVLRPNVIIDFQVGTNSKTELVRMFGIRSQLGAVLSLSSSIIQICYTCTVHSSQSVKNIITQHHATYRSAVRGGLNLKNAVGEGCAMEQWLELGTLVARVAEGGETTKAQIKHVLFRVGPRYDQHSVGFELSQVLRPQLWRSAPCSSHRSGNVRATADTSKYHQFNSWTGNPGDCFSSQGFPMTR